MSRYIDADNALRMLRNSKQDCPLKDDQRGIWDVAHNCCISCVEAAHTADAVEVVRCRDCQYCEEAHYEEEGEKPYIKLKCKWSNYSHAPIDYCSYGERKEL